jgi:hypothetical protein
MEQQLDAAMPVRRRWNKCRIIGQKPPLKPQGIWSIRVMLRMKNRFRDLALFNLAIDSKLRACDLVKLRTTDVLHGSSFLPRASVPPYRTLYKLILWDPLPASVTGR